VENAQHHVEVVNNRTNENVEVDREIGIYQIQYVEHNRARDKTRAIRISVVSTSIITY